MELLLFVLVNVLVYIFTALMAISGVGAAFIVIPILNWSGLDLLTAGAIGIFLNFISTSTQTFRHHKKRAIQYKVVIPIVIASILFVPIGTMVAVHLKEADLKFYFGLFLILAGYLIWKKKSKPDKVAGERAIEAVQKVASEQEVAPEKKSKYTEMIIYLLSGAIIGFVAGMLNVGGGSLILPLLIWAGLPLKKAAASTSFVVLFSSLFAFLAKLYYVQIDWILLLFLTITTILAGMTGSYLMYYKINKKQMKIVMVSMIWGVAAKIIFSHFF